MLYFAYGSNLHHFQMKRRCKDSVFLKKINLKNYRLTFRSDLCVADIEYKKGFSVQGALYEITDKDESCLDKYEDFPILYKKIFFKHEGRDVMAYSMEKKTPFKYPSTRYLNIIKQGYKDCDLDSKFLVEALKG